MLSFWKLFPVATSVIVLTGCVSLDQAITRYDSEPRHKAIAVDSRGTWGMSWGQASEEAAINQALQHCATHGGNNCTISRVNEARGLEANSANPAIFSGRRVSCDGIGKAEAYRLMISGHTYLDRDGDGHPCEWSSHSYFYHSTITPQSRGRNCHYVSGYRRKNGTYVSGHRRCR